MVIMKYLDKFDKLLTLLLVGLTCVLLHKVMTLEEYITKSKPYYAVETEFVVINSCTEQFNVSELQR